MADETENIDQQASRMDPAGKSLSDALRISFRLLTLIMIGVVVAFILTGFRSIQPTQKGIIKVFGRRIRTAEPGFAYNWPFPIGEIEIVDVKKKTLKIDDFWMHVRPEDKLKSLGELPIPREGLRPGWDGAVLTGDRNLLHLRIECIYQVDNPVLFAGQFQDPDEMIRSIICAAIIREASRHTAKSVQLTQAGRFEARVMSEAQKQLDMIADGAVGISSISITGRTWPLRARPAYREAQNASQDRQKAYGDAVGDADRMLMNVAGTNYRMLVGVPWEADSGEKIRRQKRIAGEEWNLIGKYNLARAAGNEEEARRIIERINKVLVSSEGQASKIINAGYEYRTAVIQGVKSRVRTFEELLPRFREMPQFMRYSRLLKVRNEILGAPANEKAYLTFGKGRTVVKISRDPEAIRRIINETRKLSESEKKQRK